MTMSHKYECVLGDRTLSIETGEIAGQADAAVTVRYGDTIVLVTACFAPEPRPDIDFVPLTVDYEERLYAAGKIPGGFIRREGRPTQAATLAARLTDRPIRPLFPKGWRQEVQIVATVLSADQENDPDILALIGASAALTISRIPFEGPIGAVRIGYAEGGFLINPTHSQLDTSTLDLVVASTGKQIVMLEAGSKEVSEAIVLEAIKKGHQVNQEVIKLLEQMGRELGKPKIAFTPQDIHEQEDEIHAFMKERVSPEILTASKAKREPVFEQIKAEVIQKFSEKFQPAVIKAAFESGLKKQVRDLILNKGIRPGGRDYTTIRPISCQIGVLPRTHGSGLFTRGETQVLTITTLGSTGEQQKLDGLSPEETKRFMHHYNMPGFSNGEVRRIGTPGRREIGHGALAEKALEPLLPPLDDFPYTVRLVSEVLSSHGSTSMASACAATLSLMDAGVPIKSPVAGIAMGLVTGPEDKSVVLTDIEGTEDFYGDMDFKVAGTSQGITAIQLDIKLKGISFEIVEKALTGARDARMKVLDAMNRTISTPRPEMSKYAPRIFKITIPTDKIGAVIGPGGKMIRSIIDETKATIDIEDDGTVLIGSPSEEAAQRAIERIESLTKEVEVGQIYTGKVTRLMNFGAFVEVLPGKEGLVHISELADFHVATVEDVVKIGDEIMVKVIEIDRLGRINLSRKAVFGESQKDGPQQREFAEARQTRPQPPREDRGRPGGHRPFEDRERRGEPRKPFFRPGPRDR
ncbi:MAG: polyribonucleotide nucleotidyltransferase [Chloroflexi bacterium]|nr:polyribonucleotide nucleotidyltransferase [Chloroflexota bacterium]